MCAAIVTASIGVMTSLRFPRFASPAIEAGGFGKSFGAKAALARLDDLMVLCAVESGPSRKDPSCSPISCAVCAAASSVSRS